MAITIEEARENHLVSDAVLDIIPEKCECGSEIMFTDSLKQIFCSNPGCLYKVAARLEDMAKKMRGPDGETCEGWGESACIEVCRAYKLISPFQIFQIGEYVEQRGYSCPTIPAFEKKIRSICDRKLRSVELWKIVELAGIPSIASIAYKIFGGYETFKEAYKDIEAGQVPFIANKLGIHNDATSVMAVNVYNNLMAYKNELLYGETVFDVIKVSGMKLEMCITGGVSGYRNKGEFVQFINKRYSGKANVILMNSVSSHVDILVAEQASTSNKYRNATKINQKNLEELTEEQREHLGEFVAGSIHPIGEKILVGTSREVIERLDKIFLVNENETGSET